MSEVMTAEHGAQGQETGEAAGAASRGMGIVKGVPGAHVQGAGALDLRGVAPEDLKSLRTVKGTGVILIDEGQRVALSHVEMAGVGGIVEIGEGERVLLQPILEMSTATLEGMASGQRFTLVGILSIDRDVPPALLQEKITALRLIGVLIATAGAQGALFDRLELVGVTVTLGNEPGPVVRGMGETRFTAGYLSHFAAGTVFLNIGKTDIAPDVDGALLAEKITAYHNVGATFGPAPLLELLQSRCPTNVGIFKPTDVEEGEAAEAAAV